MKPGAVAKTGKEAAREWLDANVIDVADQVASEPKNWLPGVLATYADHRAHSEKLAVLREAAKQTCDYCYNLDFGGEIVAGERSHHDGIQRRSCTAAAIHQMIEKLEREEHQ